MQSTSVPHIAFVLPLLVLVQIAHADNHILYECVDASGNKRFTNVASESKGCKVLNIGPLPPAPPAVPAAPPGPAPKPQAKGSAVPTPSNFPRVDRETQNQRDHDRRRILEQELDNEQKMLSQAKKELSEQESMRLGTERNYQRVLDRLEPYQKRVKLHEDNVASLRRELARVR